MAQRVGENKTRVTVTIDDNAFRELSYWVKKLDVSENQFLKDALAYYIRYQNKDFDVPDLLLQRINQVIDGMNVLSSDVKTMIDVSTAGFDSITALARGDNYLLEPDDGEL